MTDEKITELTPEQEAQIDVWRDKWIEIGLSTEPLNFEKAKAAAIKAYRAADLEPPDTWLTARSPYEGLMKIAEYVADQEGQEKTEENLHKIAREHISNQAYGAHDAYWLGFYDYFGQVVGLDCVEPLEGLIELAQHCGWWLPYDEVCLLQDRPKALHFDDEDRAHREDGPAIEYRDGWGVYIWHGVRVPEYVIMRPDEITVDDIRQEENAEVRRVKMFRYGLENFLKDSGAEKIQDDGYGELYEISTPDGPEKFVHVVNGSPEPDGTYRDYVLPTWPEVETAHEAVARSYGRTPETYAPEERT